MKQLKKLPLAAMIPLLLVGCGGGGGVDLLDAPESAVIDNPAATKKPNFKKADAPNAQDFSELGFSATAPVRILKTAADADKMFTVETDKLNSYQDDDYNAIILGGKKVSINVSGSDDAPNWAEVEHPGGFVGEGSIRYAYDATAFKPIIKVSDYDYTRVGLVTLRKDDSDVTGIFYRGKDKTTDIPVSGTAQYDGHWEFAHELSAKNDRYGSGEAGIGKLTDVHHANFKADFGQKTLTGTITTSGDEASIDYNLHADIRGNTFAGTANGRYDFHGDNNGKNDNGTATVKGGFFGPEAAELAGRVVADDKAFAAVFAAKQGHKADLKTDGDAFQAEVMPLVSSDGEHYSSSAPEKVNFSGDIMKLQVGGILIDLKKEEDSCCDGLQFMKFGKVTANAETPNAGYFAQGVLSKVSDIPKTGHADYVGYWSGYGEQKDGLFSGKQLQARFKAKWDEKKLDGSLYTENQSISAKPAIHFSAQIAGNSFAGKSDDMKVALDSSKDNLSNTAAIAGQAEVSGHFYGPSANEVGGTLRKEDGSFGAVFGGKQVNE